jgi:S-adenosylmethionine:tRNA-ribosyltransferase-isomerase (queuine synthetase)
VLYVPEITEFSYLYNPSTIHISFILITSTIEDGDSVFLQNTKIYLPLLHGIKTEKKKSKQVECFDERKCDS